MGFLAGSSSPPPPPVTYYNNPAMASPEAKDRAARQAAAAAGYRNALAAGGDVPEGEDKGTSTGGLNSSGGSGITEGRTDRGSGYSTDRGDPSAADQTT